MKQDVNCEAQLWLPTRHIMRMISYARHDVSVFRLHLSRVSLVDLIAEHGACNGLLVDIRCVRMYDSLRIMSCTLVHPHHTACVRLVHSCG